MSREFFRKVDTQLCKLSVTDWSRVFDMRRRRGECRVMLAYHMVPSTAQCIHTFSTLPVYVAIAADVQPRSDARI